MVLSIITQNLHYSIITYTRTSFGKPSRQNIKCKVFRGRYRILLKGEHRCGSHIGIGVNLRLKVAS